MFITKKRHERELAEKDVVIDRLRQLRRAASADRNNHVQAIADANRERDEALAELHTLRAAKAQRIANLATANAKRKADAAGKVG